MVAWGLIMTLMCLVNSYTGLIVLVLVVDGLCCDAYRSSFSARVFLGFAEAGLFAGKFIDQCTSIV
jgi:hypothetical protein